MPRVRGPLLSLGASGSLGNELTYRDGPSGPVARAWADPADPQSTLQLAQRAAMAGAVARWHLFTASANALDLQAWELVASLALVATGYAAHIRQTFIQHRAGNFGTNVIYGFMVTNAAHGAFGFDVTFPGAGAAAVQVWLGKTFGYQRLVLTQACVLDVLHVVGFATGVPAGGFVWLYVRAPSGSRRSGLYKVKLT
jgi:hypothetical protein